MSSYLPDWRGQGKVKTLDTSRQVFIVTHGGCPDGQASAFILQKAVKTLNSGVKVEVVQGAHSGRITPEGRIPPDSVVVFTDVCPQEGDLDVIVAARQVVVLDHHPTTEGQMKSLLENPNTKQKMSEGNFSVNNGQSCGCSLVQQYCDGVYAMDEDLLHLFWKLDVFVHKFPAEKSSLEVQMNYFKGWINQKGMRDCDLDLVEQLVKDKEGCLKKGDKIYEPVRINTRKAAQSGVEKYRNVSEKLVVYVVDMDVFNTAQQQKSGKKEIDPIDPMVYQAEIDTLIDTDISIAFITIERKVNPKTQAWNLGLRRAGDWIDMGKVASFLKEDAKAQGFVSGGGHAFAAGAQTTNVSISTDELVKVVVEACRKSKLTGKLPGIVKKEDKDRRAEPEKGCMAGICGIQ